MKVAVIGGGVFGSTAALHAARAGHEVHLYEELADLLQAASGINQYRLHRGYHYPRSPQTAASALEAETSFRAEYGRAVIDGGEQLYAIAKEGSLTTADDYLAFCDAHGLAYEKVGASPLVNEELVDVVVRVPEARFDPDALREEVRAKLLETGVRVHLNTRATRDDMDAYDRVIIAAYAAAGIIANAYAGVAAPRQYEVCEKPVVRLPDSFDSAGIVVMDGPFMCVDPMGRTDRHVLGNVKHAIHASNVGLSPIVPENLRPFLNRGVIENPPVSNFGLFVESGAPFIPALAEAEHLGSLFTVRTVLPDLDATDARPTMVTALDEKHIQIFSGKIGNCVLAARKATALLEQSPLPLERLVEQENPGAEVSAAR